MLPEAAVSAGREETLPWFGSAEWPNFEGPQGLLVSLQLYSDKMIVTPKLQNAN